MSFLLRASDKVSKLIVKDMLHSRIGGSDPARSQKTIHASDLTSDRQSYCPREVRLRELQNPPLKRPSPFIHVPLQVTFDEGRDKQKRLNEDWLLDVMYGTWFCNICNTNAVKFGKKPKKCKKCKRDFFTYHEPRIVDTISKATGGLDAVVDVGLPKLHFIECKIMTKDDFVKLKAPKAEHRQRTQLYLRQVAGSKQKFAKKIETQYAHVLYIQRGYGCKQEDGRMSPFKEFIVERDDSGIEHYLGMAHALTLSRENKKLFPAGICSTQMDARATKCPLAKKCFSSDSVGNVTWYKDGKPLHTGDHIIKCTNGETVDDCSKD